MFTTSSRHGEAALIDGIRMACMELIPSSTQRGRLRDLPEVESSSPPESSSLASPHTCQSVLFHFEGGMIIDS